MTPASRSIEKTIILSKSKIIFQMVTNVKYSSEILNMYYFKYLDDIPEMLFILTFLIKCSV